jgi:ferritin-like metal-binding protein YciE
MSHRRLSCQTCSTISAGTSGDALRIQSQRRQAPAHWSGGLPDQLLVQLKLIYRMEVGLAFDLERWFGQTNWLPLRLILADHRRETNRHIAAVGSLLPLPQGLSEAYSFRPQDGRLDRASLEPWPAAAVAAAALRAARAAAGTYRDALILATERRFAAAATLLSRALGEETETEHRLSTMAAEIVSQ